MLEGRMTNCFERVAPLLVSTERLTAELEPSAPRRKAISVLPVPEPAFFPLTVHERKDVFKSAEKLDTVTVTISPARGVSGATENTSASGRNDWANTAHGKVIPTMVRSTLSFIFCKIIPWLQSSFYYIPHLLL